MADLKRFTNRIQAGTFLAHRLKSYARNPNVVVLALPRSGVPVGFSVARFLEAPLDFLLVRKLGIPDYDEYTMGAIADGGLCILQHEILEALEIPTSVVESMAQRALREIDRRGKLYRWHRPALPLRGRTVILVDDGMATGYTMLAAVKSLRKELPARLVVATPVAPLSACQKLRAEVDDLICLNMPDPFYAVGLWYEDYEQADDEDVLRLLDLSEREQVRY
jgi:putative phosphoribosyl transferase